MSTTIVQAGEILAVQAELDWVADLVVEALWGAPAPPGASRGPGRIEVVVTRDRAPFPIDGWEPLTRGCHAQRGRVVLANAAGSGFDLRVGVDDGDLIVEARWRPPTAERLASHVLAARSRLLARAVLTQYPALWWAGCRGRVPLHASAVTSGNQTPMLAGPGGAGRSTVLLAALAHGGRTTGDNLAVTDGESIFGVTEPCKVASAAGRRTSHGRRERALAGRVDALAPDRVVLLRRSAAGEQKSPSPRSGRGSRRPDRGHLHGRGAAPLLGLRGHPDPRHGPRPCPPARARYGHSADLAAARGGAQPWTAPGRATWPLRSAPPRAWG